MSERIPQSVIEIIASKATEHVWLGVAQERNIHHVEADLVKLVRDELERAGALIQHKRRAVVTPSFAATLQQVQHYLPGNFEARMIGDTGIQERILIEGYDRAGWTLDGYVIPRLASGLIVAKEVS